MNNDTLSRLQIKSYQKRKERAALKQQINAIQLEIEAQETENDKLESKLQAEAIEAQKLEEAADKQGINRNDILLFTFFIQYLILPTR